MNRILFLSICFPVFVLLQSCSSGSSDPSIMGRSGSNMSRLTIGITDAPVSNATEVWVQFNGLSIKPVDANAIDFNFTEPMEVNLLNLYGNRSEILISNEAVPSGEYEWIRLNVAAVHDGVMDSYVRLNDGALHELEVPSGSNSGLRINNVGNLQSNNQVSLTIDFDLSKSMVEASGSYYLKPVLRLVDNSLAGSISGVIDESLLINNCSDANPLTGNAVYVFAGDNIVPDDIDGNYPEPVTIGNVQYNISTGRYEYEIGFLPEDKYTIAFTCQADLDDPETDNALDFSEVIGNVDVEMGDQELNIAR